MVLVGWYVLVGQVKEPRHPQNTIFAKKCWKIDLTIPNRGTYLGTPLPSSVLTPALTPTPNRHDQLMGHQTEKSKPLDMY